MLLIFFGLLLCSIGISAYCQADLSQCLSECYNSSNKYNPNRYECYINYNSLCRCTPRPRNNINCKDYDVSSAYRYRSKSGGACSGKCGYFGESYLWCMTIPSGWDYCAASDIGEYEPWTDIKSKIKSYVDARTGLSGTNIINKSVGGSSAAEILTAIKSENNYIYHMKNGIKFGSSINQVDKIFIPGFNERPETHLTLAVSAKIDVNNYNAKPTCDAIASDAKSYWHFLHPGKNDSIAYLISSKFGGSGDKYNILPINFGKIKFNSSNSDTCDQRLLLWDQIDSSIEHFLTKNQGYVDYNVIVNYGNLPVSLRPTHFILQISLKQTYGNPLLDTKYPFNGTNTIDVLINNNN